jgi:hypothetical protein
MMHVLDVRLNPKIDRDTLQKIMEQVMINSSGKETEVINLYHLLFNIKKNILIIIVRMDGFSDNSK